MRLRSAACHRRAGPAAAARGLRVRRARSRAATRRQRAAASAGAFPATVTHKFGETVVPEEPKRVVSVGVTEQDVLLQLGVVPGRRHGVVRRAARRHLAVGARPARRRAPRGAQPADGFEFEKIAALKPDLIVGTNAGMTEEGLRAALGDRADDHQRRGRRPTSSRRGRTRCCRSPAAWAARPTASRSSTTLEAAYAEVAAEHPDWADKTATFSQGGAVRRDPLRLPGRAEHRLPHRARLHDDDRPRGATPPRRARRPRSPRRTSA